MKVQSRSSFLPERVAQSPTSEAKVTVSANKAQAPRDAFVSAGAGQEVQAKFREQFGQLAADPKKFHETMKSIFGSGYDAKTAEAYRQRALEGDFSWTPPVRWVDSQTLQGANGAYDAESGTVLINRDLQGNPSLAASTYVEEAGHHLDTQLNVADSPGDEGELFRRVLSGEKLTSAQIAEIRAENDKGIIYVDGKAKEVEFWNPFKAVGNAISGAAKAVGNAVSGAAKAVGNAVVGAAKGVGNAVVSVGKGLLGGAKTFFTGIGEGVGGFFKNLVTGHVGDALGSLIRGADKAFFQAPQRILSGAFDGAQNLLDGATQLLGPLGKPIRKIGTGLLDAGRTLTDTGIGIARDVFRTVTEVPAGFVKDVEQSARLLFQGKFSEAAKQFGMSFVNAGSRAVGGVVDVLARGLQGVGNAVLTAVGAEAPSRGLSEDEKKMLRGVYGDSIDYDVVRIKKGGSTDWFNMAPHVVGNTVYMPSTWDGQPTFNPDGTLTPSGAETVVHELGHVWQNQNGGGDYLHKALLSQLIATIKGGSRNGAYDWRGEFAKGVPFEKLNPEQQAHLAEDIGIALHNDNKVEASDWSPPLSAAELAYVTQAWEQIKRGEGAP